MLYSEVRKFFEKEGSNEECGSVFTGRVPTDSYFNPVF
ncbi:hypothetical protein LEP1GSC073_4191 [Leptospira noguchii str. Cascata]|nr:hypothetical protein LEP1GSC073_4191 [Leptospira noguchii str. Cascata]